MTAFLAYRGPDGQRFWLDGPVGFGHALLKTTGDSGIHDQQPAHLEGLSITADVRLDSADQLKTQLKQMGRNLDSPVSDANLILYAYAAWGPNCVDRLRGDFSFGIWDEATKTLFCARDHFGVKPFFYAQLNNLFLFSNTLNCLRQHHAVSNQLNKSTIGDFLLFGINYDQSTTTFRDIRRLPAAHTLTVSRDGLQTRCYWHPPTEGRIHYARGQDYVDHFNDILKTAVSDRLLSDHAGIFLSGGLDSGAVAAVAREISNAREGRPALQSYTVGYSPLIPAEDGLHGRKLAEYLNLPNTYISFSDTKFFEEGTDKNYCLPEPLDDPLSAALFKQFDTVARDVRVVFSGEGADNLMYFQMWPHIQDLRRHKKWVQLARETAWFLWIRPLPWRGLASRAKSLFGRNSHHKGFPSWITAAFAKEAGLIERWEQHRPLGIPEKRHSTRPKAYASMLLPHWTKMFELHDPGVTHAPVQVHYPFLDLRIVDFLLGIPAFPWIFNKTLLRKAMRGRLPEEIRTRPKTPLAADPVQAILRRDGIKSLSRRVLEGPICEFVVPSALNDICASIEPERLRPYCLDAWFKALS